MKQHLLEEMKYWRQSCDTSVKEISHGLTSLRDARDNVKREMHMARAQIEERMREVELMAEARLFDIVTTEEMALQTITNTLRKKQKQYV